MHGPLLRPTRALFSGFQDFIIDERLSSNDQIQNIVTKVLKGIGINDPANKTVCSQISIIIYREETDTR
jgi:hypothetical protein